MTRLCTLSEFNKEFGLLSSEALDIVTRLYPFLLFQNKEFIYHFRLKDIFSEAIDLFTIDPSLLTDSFIINKMFADESIHTDITMNLSELVQNGLDYIPITEDGEFWMTFADIRTCHGTEAFDREMYELFPNEYKLIYNYFME